MTKWCIPGLTALAVAVASGCASTSDDPREGGLFGYWQHGEEGYQKRLDARREQLSEAETRAADAQSESSQLEQRLDARRSEVAAQREAMEDLSREIEALEQALASAPATPPDQQSIKGELQDDVAKLNALLDALETDEDALIEERQRRINELNKEMKLLRERASLLTTL